MENLFDFNPADFGLAAPMPDDNGDKLRADNSIPSAAIQSSTEDPNLLNNLFLTRAQESKESPVIRKEYPKELTEKYKGTAAYSPWMNPYADNEKVAAENWTKWDAVSTGLAGMLDNAKLAGFEYAKGWSRAGRALFNLDASYLMPNEAEMAVINQQQKSVQARHPIYYSPNTQDDIFSRQFLSEALQNTGFTFGTLAGFAVETAAEDEVVQSRHLVDLP